jgi:hypothetical protein
MSEPTQAVGATLERQVRHCWPTPWLESAMRAGFAHYKGGGEWVFINEKMRDMLVEFGAGLQRDERERCAMLAESARPPSGRAGSSEQAACFEALTHVAQCIRNA